MKILVYLLLGISTFSIDSLTAFAQSELVPPTPSMAAPQEDPLAPPPQVQDPLLDPMAPAQDASAVEPAEMTDPLLEGFFEDISYNPADKRDPFLPYMSPTQRMTIETGGDLEPLQKFALAELKLVGIIWDVGKPKALIQDPSGKSHIIIENTKLGSGMGYVAAIREGELIVVEQQLSAEGKKSYQTKILKLAGVSGATQ